MRNRKRVELLLALLTILTPPLAGEGLEPAPAAANDPFGSDWPAGHGRELTGALCIACHSLALVKQQRLSRDDWDEVLYWMVEEQGMAPLDDKSRSTVLSYLSTHFGVEK